MKLENGPILPSIGISIIKLNITKQKLLDIIGKDYKEKFLEIGSIIVIENARFWIADDGRVDQIGVGKDFKGKYKDIMGIGSTFSNVKEYVGNYIKVYDTYELQGKRNLF